MNSTAVPDILSVQMRDDAQIQEKSMLLDVDTEGSCELGKYFTEKTGILIKVECNEQ